MHAGPVRGGKIRTAPARAGPVSGRTIFVQNSPWTAHNGTRECDVTEALVNRGPEAFDPFDTKPLIKFQSIILNRGGDVSISLTVQDNVVIPSDHIRVLGVTLDDSLKFDLHISDMCKKASRQINALKRISKFLTQDSRKSIYRSFIAANFNYCPISWMFCGKKNTSKLEKLQERALRLVFCDQISSYDDLLKRGNFLSLKAYRIKCLAVEVFKCVHGFNPTYLNRLFTEPLANYNLRDRRRLNQPRFHTYTYGFRSFRYSGSKLWNSLPRAIKNTNDINEFKKNITEWCQTCDLTKLEIF